MAIAEKNVLIMIQLIKVNHFLFVLSKIRPMNHFSLLGRIYILENNPLL